MSYSSPNVAIPAFANAPWRWAAAGALGGLLIAFVLFAPARWLATLVLQASGGHAMLAAPRGNFWQGSAQLVLSGGAGSLDAVALPGQVSWRIRPAWQAGRPVARIVPELTPPSGDGVASLHVTGTADQPQLMRTGPEGVTLLPLSVASAALMAWPEDAEVLAEPGVAELAEHFFNRPARLQTPPERWLAAAQSDWDLAQFDLLYTRGTRTRKHLSAMTSSLFRSPRWRAARWASVALVLANVVGLQAWAWKEQSSQAAQRAAIRNLLTTTFPDVRVVVDAPVQMARALSDLQRRNGIASTADMETQLGHFKAAAPDTPVPAAIEFISTELRLKGLSLPASAVAEIAARLQAQGYRLRMDAEGLTMKEERFP